MFRVAGATFAKLAPDGTVELLCGAERAGRALAKISQKASPLAMGDTTVGIRVVLADVNGMELNRFVYQAWLHHAPEALTAPLRAAEAGAAPAGRDALPANLGRPATGALLTAGITSLTEVSAWSPKRLLALHGFGPKALKLLQAALAERGMELAADE